MYGSLKQNKSAQSIRHNLKFFDSSELASENNTNEINEAQKNKCPTYYDVNNLLQKENFGTSNDSILKCPDFGSLTIKFNERNIRHNIKFFDSTEMNCQSKENYQKLPGYFQINDILQFLSKNSYNTTKLFI